MTLIDVIEINRDFTLAGEIAFERGCKDAADNKPPELPGESYLRLQYARGYNVTRYFQPVVLHNRGLDRILADIDAIPRADEAEDPERWDSQF